ncbi:MAG: tetratricopeptide repeat protein, partial [Paracoccaceae bacterium]
MKNTRKTILLILGLVAALALVPNIPRLATQGAQALQIDTFLCSKFPTVACEIAANQTTDPEKKTDFLVTACAAGWTRCVEHATTLRDENKNTKDALRLLNANCDAGSVAGCFQAGVTHFQSDSFDKAADQFRTACEDGVSIGCNNLGIMYRDALGVPQDYVKAVDLFSQGCDGGEVLGCTNLGSMYANALGVPQDYAKAVDLFRQGCDGGEVL